MFSQTNKQTNRSICVKFIDQFLEDYSITTLIKYKIMLYPKYIVHQSFSYFTLMHSTSRSTHIRKSLDRIPKPCFND
jgi:hypothetical protein